MNNIEAIARIIKTKMKNRIRNMTTMEMTDVSIYSEPVDYEHKVKKETIEKEYHFIQLTPKDKFYIKEEIAKDCIDVFYIHEGQEIDLKHPWLSIPNEVLDDVSEWIDRNNPSRRKKRVKGR